MRITEQQLDAADKAFVAAHVGGHDRRYCIGAAIDAALLNVSDTPRTSPSAKPPYYVEHEHAGSV